MNQLFLEDLAGSTDAQVREYINANFGGDRAGYDGRPGILKPEDFDDRFDVLIAYVSVGSWGCDSSAFFLLREKNTGNLFEVHGSHCSCYGFEGQWQPEGTGLEYLKSDKFSFSTGGYDDNARENEQKVREFLAAL